MQFDPIRSPIEPGLTLLEAGAGTGKTYSLVRIIARELVEEEIPVDRILTVTFTRAATAEIKARLHALLTEVLAHLKEPPEEKPNDLAAHWTARGEEFANAARTRISVALAAFDSAPIFTIDGFFQRLMREYAFESQVPFSVELETDEAALVDTALRDYWRQHVYPLTGADLEMFGRSVKLAQAQDFIGEALRNADAELAPEYSRSPGEQIETFAGRWRGFVALLGQRREALREFVDSPPDGILKSSTPFKKGTAEKFWTEVDRFLEQPDKLPKSPGRLVYIAGSRLFAEKAFKKGQYVDLRGHGLADLFEAVDGIVEAFPAHLASAYLGEIYRYVGGRLEQLKAERRVQTYNGVTAHLAGLFDSGSAQAEAIKRALKRRYGAVLIDEFQDTSPQQCSVFLNLFRDRDQFFHIIGDPKQSIYRFRGADVFSYIRASEKADRQ